MAAKRSSTFSPRADAALNEIDQYMQDQKERALLARGFRDIGINSSLLNDLNTVRKRLLAAERAETIKQQKQADKLIRAYALKVGQAFTKGNITTNKEIERVIAAAYAEMMAQSYGAVSDIIGRWASSIGREELYSESIKQLTKSSFSLFVYDADAIRQAEELAGRLELISARLKPYAEKAVYDCLWAAFSDSWAELDFDQFPLEYRIGISRVITRLKSQRTLAIQGSSIKHWEIYVDFEKIFGDSKELTEGYHYGALIETTEAEGSGRRVGLPYKFERLKNPPARRFQYWKAVWSGEPYNAGYDFTTQRNSTLARNRRRETYANLFKAKSEEIANLEADTQYGASASQKTRLANLHAQRSELRTQGLHNLNTKLEPIDTTGQRAATIAARMRAWSPKTPYWLFLEFGQLQWAPHISPKGVRYRFYNYVQKIISEMVRDMYNDEFRNQGVGFGVSGRTYLAAGTKPSELAFSNISPTTKPGGFLPKTLIEKVKKPGKSARRNAAEAAKISGKFGPVQRIEQQDQMLQNALARTETGFKEVLTRKQRAMRRSNVVDYNDPVLRGGGSSFHEIREGWAAIRGSEGRDELTYQEAKARILKSVEPLPTGGGASAASGFVGNIDMKRYKPSIRGKRPRKT